MSTFELDLEAAISDGELLAEPNIGWHSLLSQGLSCPLATREIRGT